MHLDFSSLKKALGNLDRALTRSRQVPDDEEIRDAVIQRFEYSYELCWKMLKRQIEQESATPAAVDAYSFRQLIREGAERGILSNVEIWLEFREQRNITSHTYDADKAASVYKTAELFYPHARKLLEVLESRRDD